MTELDPQKVAAKKAEIRARMGTNKVDQFFAAVEAISKSTDDDDAAQQKMDQAFARVFGVRPATVPVTTAKPKPEISEERKAVAKASARKSVTSFLNLGEE